MTRNDIYLFAAALGAACSTPSSMPAHDAGPACTPVRATETMCSDRNDDDCDGRIDCLDSDCEGQACGSMSGYACMAGGCVHTGTFSDNLPPIENVRVTMHGDTAILDFNPIDGARDYRVYAMPAPEDIFVGGDGEQVVRNAIYHCGGDRQFTEFDTAMLPITELGGNLYDTYTRPDSDEALGYVYTTPSDGRLAVHRLGSPDPEDELNTGYVGPMMSEAHMGRYVPGEDAYHTLLAQGWRDDGIAFYLPAADAAGTVPVYEARTPPGFYSHGTAYMLDGPERTAFEARHADFAAGGQPPQEVFRVLSAPAPGTAKLHRVIYHAGGTYDVLAAGEAAFDRALHQGNTPVWFLAYSGLTQPTTLVIEALDQGCPFPGGHISYAHAVNSGEPSEAPMITLDEARLSSGEVFVNGQFDTTNRPRPIARAFVDVAPEPRPDMDWFEGFEPGTAWTLSTPTDTENNGFFYFRDDNWVADFTWCTDLVGVGPVLGQLVTGQGDWGAGCHFRLSPRHVTPMITDSSFLHVRMDAEVPSTGRRYPQIIITTTPIVELGSLSTPNTTPLQERLIDGNTIIVQPFGSASVDADGIIETQLEYCDHVHWNVNLQCPGAEIDGPGLRGHDTDPRTPWVPAPILGDLSGFDRPVRFDVYASTERVYIFVEGRPAGCGMLPTMPAGPVTVAFGAVIYHSGIDSPAYGPSPEGYLYRHSPVHIQRHFDNLGIDSSVPEPEWDETLFPCTSTWLCNGISDEDKARLAAAGHPCVE